MRNTSERVQKLVAMHFGRPIESVTPAQSFVADLGADSLDDIEFVMALEDEFGIQITDKTWEPVVTVGDAIALVERLAPVGA